MLKVIAQIDFDGVSVFNYDMVLAEAKKDDETLYQDFLEKADEELNFCHVTVGYMHETGTSEEFDCRIYIIQNPLMPIMDIKVLAPLWDEIAKREVATFLARQEAKQQFEAQQRIKRNRKNAKRSIKKVEPNDFDDIPF